MKTRVELWKGYRKSISSNVFLKQALYSSSEKLQLLYKRLFKIYPDYEKTLFGTSLPITFDELPPQVEIKTRSIDSLLQTLDKLETSRGTTLSYFDNLHFSSNELDDLIEAINKGKDFQYIKTDADLISSRATHVKLPKAKKMLRIAIDGPSGSGKSTVARQVAKDLKYRYINTGLFYRAISLYLLNKKIDLTSEDEISKALKLVDIKLLKDDRVLLNNKDVSQKLKTDIISQVASKIAVLENVRNFAVSIQRSFAAQPGIVMEGRDTTFRIMPEAEVKIFLTTDAKVRAQRRVKQNQSLGFKANYDETLAQINERDLRDSSRLKDPLHKTADAVEIDATNLSIAEVVAKIKAIAKARSS